MLALFLLGPNPVMGQADVSGEWSVSLTLPREEMGFTMMLVQKGEKLTGYMLSEIGQFMLEGAVNRDQVKISWSFPDGGKTLPVTFIGKAEGSSMSGTAKVGDVGQGPMSAQRK